MIKGHTLIDLKNIHTGEVEHWEDDNMVTNALTYFLAQGGMTNPTGLNSYIKEDILTRLLGGVMLLDTALTEQATNVRVPSGVGMTANGAIGVVNNDNPTELGSYNSNESGWQQDGSFKMVWDWTTSQGNGTINCVSLTNQYQGMRGIGNKSLGYKTNSFNVDSYNSTESYALPDNDVRLGYYQNKVVSIKSIKNVTAYTVNLYPFPVTSQDVRDNRYVTTERRKIDSFNIEIPNDLKNISSGIECYTNYSANGHVYGYFSAATPSTVYVLDINVASKTGTWTTISAASLGLTINTTAKGISDTHIIMGNYLVNLSNTADNYEILNLANTASIFAYNGARFINETGTGTANPEVIDVSTHTALPTNGAGTKFHGATANSLIGLYTEYNSVWNNKTIRDVDYIATINNLDSAVTKTADKTMKVTYILRFS